MPHHIMILGFKTNTGQGLHSLVVTFITTLRKILQLILVLITMISAQTLIRDTEQLTPYPFVIPATAKRQIFGKHVSRSSEILHGGWFLFV